MLQSQIPNLMNMRRKKKGEKKDALDLIVFEVIRCKVLNGI